MCDFPYHLVCSFVFKLEMAVNNDTANEQTSGHIIQGQIEVASHSDLTNSHHYTVCGTSHKYQINICPQ